MFGDASASALEEKIHNVLCRPEERMLRYWSALVNGAMYEGGRQFGEMTVPVKIIEPLISLVELERRNYT